MGDGLGASTSVYSALLISRCRHPRAHTNTSPLSFQRPTAFQVRIQVSSPPIAHFSGLLTTSVASLPLPRQRRRRFCTGPVPGRASLSSGDGIYLAQWPAERHVHVRTPSLELRMHHRRDGAPEMSSEPRQPAGHHDRTSDYSGAPALNL